MKHLVRLGIASAFFSMLALFSIASPPGSAPDEPFHIYSGWCFQDETGFCETKETYEGSRLIQVPEKWAHANCYGFHPETSAFCINEIPKKRVIDIVINQGAYPNGYYALLSLLIGNNEIPNIYDARIMLSFLIGLIFLAILYVSSGSSKPALWIVPILLLSPLPFFLISSLNPSGLAFCLGILKLLVAIRLLDEKHELDQLRWGAALIFVSLLEIQVRRDSALLFTIGVFGYFVVKWNSERISKNAKISIFISGLIATFAAIKNQQVSAALSGELGGNSGFSTGKLILRNLIELPELYAKSIVGSLGWNDTHLFGMAYFLPLLAFGGIVAFGVIHWHRATLKGILLVGTATLLIPISLGLATQQTFSMQSIQGRYVFPLLVSFVTVLLPTVSASHIVSLRMHTYLNSMFTIALIPTIWIVIRRFSAGLAVELDSVPESFRWWPWPWSPDLQIFAFAAIAMLFILLSRINMKQNLERTHSALN